MASDVLTYRINLFLFWWQDKKHVAVNCNNVMTERQTVNRSISQTVRLRGRRTYCTNKCVQIKRWIWWAAPHTGEAATALWRHSANHLEDGQRRRRRDDDLRLLYSRPRNHIRITSINGCYPGRCSSTFKWLCRHRGRIFRDNRT